jgi:hypothetical protein
MNEPITEQLYNKVVNFVNKMDCALIIYLRPCAFLLTLLMKLWTG